MNDLSALTFPMLLTQVTLGLVNGCFYAMLSLGLAVIFGMLRVINFAHGAMFMLGALLTWAAQHYLGVGYWPMLLIAPLVVALFSMTFETLALRPLYRVDHLFGFLLTLGLTMVLEGSLRFALGSSGNRYPTPEIFRGVLPLGFMVLPKYRAWIVGASLAVCLATWYAIERTRLGAYLRAGTENPKIVEAFGINVPVMMTLTYGFGSALAALAGVLAAPVLLVSPLMAQDLMIIVFAVVVIGGMGSILGSVSVGLLLGLIEGASKVIYPPASTTIVFVVMVIVLLTRTAGLFGRKD
jgi:branched-chain amino acid transport system permease protein